jgi:hypothetical protein
MKCANCGRHANRQAKYCESCGHPLTLRRSAPAETSNQPRWALYSAILISGILLGAVVMYFSQDKTVSVAATDSAFDPRLRGAQLQAAFPEVYQVAAQFICPCGTCTDGLEVCDCEMVKGASEVRQFIFDNFSAGHRAPHIIEMVEAKYGYRKNGRPPITFENLPPTTNTEH